MPFWTKFAGCPIRIVPDCSFLAHALLTTQLTPQAAAALAEASAAGDVFIASDALPAEFLSLLRKAVTRRDLPPALAEAVRDWFDRLDVVRVEVSAAVLARAWELAVRLNLSDVFDALGYAVAESEGGQFWTSDLRFVNAAEPLGLAGIRYIA